MFLSKFNQVQVFFKLVDPTYFSNFIQVCMFCDKDCSELVPEYMCSGIY